MSFLNQPYPYYHQRERLLKIAALLFLVGFVFEYFWVPFERNESEHLYSYFIITLFHIGVAVAGYLIYFFVLSFFVFDDDWKIYKETVAVLGLLTLIGIGEWGIRPVIYTNKSLSLNYLVLEIWHAYLAGGLIYSVVTYVNFNLLIRKNAEYSTKLSTGKQEVDHRIIKIETQSQNDNFILDPSHLICAKADGNYLEIYLDNEQSPLIKRITLQSFERQLTSTSQFIRTHRAYLVNRSRIAKVKGNAQGYQLSLNGVDFVVPVSRKNLKEFNTAMA